MTKYRVFGYINRNTGPKFTWTGIEANTPEGAVEKVRETKRLATGIKIFGVIAESNFTEVEVGHGPKGETELHLF